MLQHIPQGHGIEGRGSQRRVLKRAETTSPRPASSAIGPRWAAFVGSTPMTFHPTAAHRRNTRTTPDVEETAGPDVARHDSQLTGRRPESCGQLSLVHVGVEFSIEPAQTLFAREHGAESDPARSTAQDAAGGYVPTRRAERPLAQLVIPPSRYTVTSVPPQTGHGVTIPSRCRPHLGGSTPRLVAGRRRPLQAMERARARVRM